MTYQHLLNLLNTENSQIASSVRDECREEKSLLDQIEGFLVEIKSKVEDGSTKFPQDPVAKECKLALEELESLYQLISCAKTTNQSQENNITSNDSNSKDTQELTPPDSVTSNFTPNDEFKLSHLKKTFESDQELHKYLIDYHQLKSKTDSGLWNEIQRKLLRLPKKMASYWGKTALKLAQEAGAKSDQDTSNMEQLSSKDDNDDNKVIYPGLKESISAKGLCLSKKALLNQKISQVIESKDLSEELDVLASIVSICMTFINLEPDLCHALEIVDKFDIIALNSNPKQREKYINILIQRFQYTVKAEKNADNDPVSLLKAWIALDEAIHSLVFIPPADSDSWWGELKKRSRRILRNIEQKVRDFGHDVRIQELGGLYADIYKLSSKDYDLKLQNGGIPGEVQTCLRVYARIDQEELPGRVIFRSLA